ncbi:hypothetical protein DEJ23_06340 [Curtobacterium sp. MCSS17_008]|uniref:glycosyltransferase n=1 Tax=Curtobacterium sp. MCSS17_008 TaxID=2175647 RepID=UPI000DA8C61D|nr:glycosyltransferase [Curtobacterium sp. MCSS17_008]PZF57756.1 hypothetical protein DEJ23_06340 [Curtobacterium sp. MCSS17_008]
MKSVNLVVSHLSPELGLERCVRDLVGVLNEENLSVRVISIGGPAEPDEAYPVDVRLLSLGHALTGFSRVKSVARMWKFFRKEPQGEVFILCGIWAALPSLVAKSRAQRVVVWEHSLNGSKTAASRPLRVLGWFARFLYRRAEHIVAVSQDVATFLCNSRLNRVAVIANPVTIGRRVGNSRERTSGPKRLLAVGSLTETKNQELLLRALALAGWPFTLTILGDGPKRADLQGLARELGIQDHVVFRGHVASSDVQKYLATTDLLVHPSLGETFGLVLFEAAEASVPVVAVDAAVMSHFVGVAVPGRLSEPIPEAFEAALRLELHTTRDEEELRAAARERRKLIDLQSIRESWMETLTSIANAD